MWGDSCDSFVPDCASRRAIFVTDTAVIHGRVRACGKAKNPLISKGFRLERVTGIEPALSAWEADVLPLNYTRVSF